MGANAYWSDFYHRVIILEFRAEWTHCEYSKLVKDSGFARIGVTYKGYINLLAHRLSESSMMFNSICRAIDLRMAICEPFTFMYIGSCSGAR